uniref:Uncharacterized protein n=1 Tax=Arundo donax TaxID=35708 RepID=A0A0A9B1Y3_ARUDO
MAALWTSRA